MVSKAGPGRDKQIAEMRGEAENCIDCQARWECRMCGDAVFKPYSTDISCAMELLDDMRYEIAEIEITWIKQDEQWLIRPYKTDEDVDFDEFVFEVREGELADAISGTWIKWREK